MLSDVELIYISKKSAAEKGGMSVDLQNSEEGKETAA